MILHRFARPRALVVSLLLWSITACNSQEQPPLNPDGSRGADATISDGISVRSEGGQIRPDGSKDSQPSDVTLGDAPSTAAITCSPAKVSMSKLNSVCAQASVVLDHSAVAGVKCSLQAGEARTAEPMMLFTRQDDPCAGPGISEIIFFISTNKTINFLTVTPKGVIEKADTTTLREIPYLMVVDTTFALASNPKKKYWMRLRGGKYIEVLGLRPL